MILLKKGTRLYAVFLFFDRKLARLLGMRYGDKYSISAQCWKNECRGCRWLGKVLGLIQADHFEIAAKLEDFNPEAQ